ncbi:MAG: cupin domain-containing protein [Anaerolineae bacterium]|nr:cupin domain-containing protein [Anaerolineae bacterium]
MLHRRMSHDHPKGWFCGPWDSTVPIPVGYANTGVQERHVHRQMYEIYLIAQGSSIAEVGGERVTLQAGDILVVEPGEVHTFLDSSSDYVHFVIQTPFVKDDKFVESGNASVTKAE